MYGNRKFNDRYQPITTVSHVRNGGGCAWFVAAAVLIAAAVFFVGAHYEFLSGFIGGL